MPIAGTLSPQDLARPLEKMWALSARKIADAEQGYDAARGSPVFTIGGKWSSRGWTEWTEGFKVGSALLQYDATGEESFLDLGRRATVERMAPHLTHMGVHDHGFNNVSSYGNLWRLMNEGRIPESPWERSFYELALKVSGAVQARRWTGIEGGGGYIYSFNGPHSLFVDTIRSLRALALSHQLGHSLMEEGDRKVSLLERLVQHAQATARFSVFYGEGRDAYDEAGRVAHECIFNLNDGRYRCPSSQQGYSPFSTWTRGLAWAILGFAEELEFLCQLPPLELAALGGREAVIAPLRRAALATARFYLANSASDGIPYWDTGAPGLGKLGDWRGRPADPFNEEEPVDSSAAAIACQGLLRLAAWLEADEGSRGRAEGGAEASRFEETGLGILSTLLEEPYLSEGEAHQGLLLHSVYHLPNGWDFIPPGRSLPCGESSMWGDYHLREAALYAQRKIEGALPLAFWTTKEET